jgi:adenine-specific DNA-methyltransferase
MVPHGICDDCRLFWRFLNAGAKRSLHRTQDDVQAEINANALETLHSGTSRPFDNLKSGRIALKVINH